MTLTMGAVACIQLEDPCELPESDLEAIPSEEQATAGYLVVIESELGTLEELRRRCGDDVNLGRAGWFQTRREAVDALLRAGGPPCSEWQKYLLPLACYPTRTLTSFDRPQVVDVLAVEDLYWTVTAREDRSDEFMCELQSGGLVVGNGLKISYDTEASCRR